MRGAAHPAAKTSRRPSSTARACTGARWATLLRARCLRRSSEAVLVNVRRPTTGQGPMVGWGDSTCSTARSTALGDLDAVQDLVESSSRRGANVASWSSTFQRRLDLLRLICHHHHRHQGHPTSWRCPWSVEAPSRPFGTSRAPGILGS
jgi:hypothetical protein